MMTGFYDKQKRLWILSIGLLVMSSSCGETGEDLQRAPDNSEKRATGTVTQCADEEVQKANNACQTEGQRDPITPVISVDRESASVRAGKGALFQITVIKDAHDVEVTEFIFQGGRRTNSRGSEAANLPIQKVEAKYGAGVFCVYVPPEAPAGTYKGEFVAVDAGGTQLTNKPLQIELEVTAASEHAPEEPHRCAENLVSE